jgi:hypothetical protein
MPPEIDGLHPTRWQTFGKQHDTLAISICQWPPVINGGHRWPPSNFPAAGMLLTSNSLQKVLEVYYINEEFSKMRIFHQPSENRK